MVETKEETTTNDFPLYNGGQGGEEAMGAVVYPQRPGEQECQYYLKTGTCKYATKCKFHHPPDVTPIWAAVAPATDVTVGLNKESYPRRPGEQQCTFFLKTGTCKYKMSCKFDHPPEAIQQTLQLQSTPYPVRPGEQHCTYYLKTGKCKFGATCRFDHPPMAPEQAAALAAAYPPQPGMPGADGRGMAMGMGMGPPRGPQGMMGSMAYYNPHDPNMMGLMPAPGPMGYGGPATTAAMLPQRPGEKECTFFLRTGRCQYGARCKFHHPLEKLAAITGGAMGPPGAAHAHPGMHPHAVAHGHGIAPGGYPGVHPMDPAVAYGGYGAVPPMRGAGGPQGPGADQSLPSRPGAEACGYYLRTGKCSYGSSCRYDHPRSNSSSRETSDSGATSGSATSGQGQAGGAAGADGQGAYGVGVNGQGAYPGGAYGEPGGVYGQGAGAEAYGGAAGGFVAYHQYPGQAPPVYASYRQAS